MPDLVIVLGAGWRGNVEPLSSVRFADRRATIGKKTRLIDAHLPEYRKGGAAVLDLSCGNGVFLELMRYYGNTIMGAEVKHFLFLESQGIPYVELNGNDVPYPFADKSFDLVSCIGAITAYDSDRWRDVLDEMFRIARRTVFVIANHGPRLDAHRPLLDLYRPEGWRCTNRDTVYKWTCV